MLKHSSVPADCHRAILVLLLRSKTGDASLRYMYQDITLFLVLFKLFQFVLSDMCGSALGSDNL